jgi:tetratricopeptide (TPR) repeat protein
MGELPANLFRTTPNPLEVRGGTIDARVDGRFPEKFFNKHAVVTVTPILKFDGQEVKGTPRVFQGERVVGNNQVINRRSGGSFTIGTAFDFVPEMAKSELYLDFEIVRKGKAMPKIPQVKVADGVIATSTLANASEIAPAITPDAFQRIIQQTQEASIHFLIQQSDLRNSETRSQDMRNLATAVRTATETTNQEIESLNVVGYASPDGPFDLNRNLAERRTNVSANFLNTELRRQRTPVEIGRDFTPEDWAGFQRLMEQSNIQDRDLILRVLSMYSDPEQREREIRNISSAFTVIAEEILPQLRRARMQLTVNIIGKSDEEITQLAASNPAALNVEELLYAATLTQDLNRKAAIYQDVIRLFGNDARGYNNLGMVRLQQGNVADALTNFQRAERIDPNNPDINYNLGLVALINGNLDQAEQFFGKAAGTGADLNQALGTLYTKTGEYTRARTSFAETASNNAALLQILNSDYNAARRTLSAGANPDGTTAYLQAIVGARTNDRDAVYNNLRTAISKDRTLAQRAMTDMEFSRFFTDQTFLSIVR